MIILDFDGTIVDVWARYYSVFCEAMGCSSVNSSDYKMAKLRHRNDENVARELGLTMPHDYFSKKRDLLEKKRFLKKDTLLIEKDDLLAWFRNTDSILLTKRRNKDNLIFELSHLGLESIEDRVIVLDPDSGVSKKAWVACNLSFAESGQNYVIGDSEEDMLIGENPRIKPLFVRSGLQADREGDAKEEAFERIGGALRYIESRENYVF